MKKKHSLVCYGSYCVQLKIENSEASAKDCSSEAVFKKLLLKKWKPTIKNRILRRFLMVGFSLLFSWFCLKAIKRLVLSA